MSQKCYESIFIYQSSKNDAATLFSFLSGVRLSRKQGRGHTFLGGTDCDITPVNSQR